MDLFSYMLGKNSGGSGGGSGDSANDQLIGLFNRTGTEFTIPEGVTQISGVFSYWMNLKTVNFPSTVTHIGANAFTACYALTMTELPNQIVEIGQSAFNSAKIPLTRLPDSLENVGISAFQYATSLAVSEIPAKVKYISKNAFQNAISSEVLTFKGTPETIANNAFDWCYKILTINVPWAEGEVANAPWGATNATINYNYVEG